MIAVIILSFLLLGAIAGLVIFYIFWQNANNAAETCKQPVSACNYSTCASTVFKNGDMYIGTAAIPESKKGFNYVINVPMAIKILTQTTTQTKDGATAYYTGTMTIHKHDGSGPSSEFYFTYGGCTEAYFYSPSTCKFSYTKSRCLSDKELPPVDKDNPGVAANCCSGTCTGTHSGANTIIRNIEYDAKNDAFNMTLYNNDNKKATTFALTKSTSWPTKFVDRDKKVYDNGCTYSNKTCNCT